MFGEPAATAALDVQGQTSLAETDGRQRKIVFVCGSGRSGTSTFAGIMRELGLHVPQPEVGVDETNPKGFGEPQWLVDFHSDLLERVHVHMSDARPDAWNTVAKLAVRGPLRERAAAWLEEQFVDADELVVKDPRLSWFLSLWRTAAGRVDAEPVFVTMLRHPAEVVRSKQTYYKQRTGDSHGIAGWINVMLLTERATRGSTRQFVRYADVIQDWPSVIQPLGDELGLLSVQTTGPDAMRRVHGFVDPSLHRITPTWDELDAPDVLLGLVREAWDLFNTLAEPGGDVESTHTALDELLERYTAFYSTCEQVAHSSVISARSRGHAEAIRAARDDMVGRVKDAAPGWARAMVPPGVRRRLRDRIGRPR